MHSRCMGSLEIELLIIDPMANGSRPPVEIVASSHFRLVRIKRHAHTERIDKNTDGYP